MNPQTYIIYTVSRKFKYLKKTVYKKCDEINLFDHSTRDITERNAFLINVLLSAFLLYQTDGAGFGSMWILDLNMEFFYQVLNLFLVDEVDLERRVNSSW